MNQSDIACCLRSNRTIACFEQDRWGRARCRPGGWRQAFAEKILRAKHDRHARVREHRELDAAGSDNDITTRRPLGETVSPDYSRSYWPLPTNREALGSTAWRALARRILSHELTRRGRTGCVHNRTSISCAPLSSSDRRVPAADTVARNRVEAGTRARDSFYCTTSWSTTRATPSVPRAISRARSFEARERTAPFNVTT